MEAPYCRLLPSHVAEGPWNMAADEVLLETAASGVASLRFYGWARPTLSLGYFQSETSVRAYPGLGELPCVRRSSGGAALVHHLEVTYALGLPAGLPWQKRGESWLCRMHAIIDDALASLGAKARLCGDKEENELGDVLCFLHHEPGDLLLGASKIVGSAQRKQRGALMQHGGILLAASPFTPVLTGIRELTGIFLSTESLCVAVTEHFTRQTNWELHRADWSLDERRRIDELITGKYASSAWTRKR
jgi:lipoate-protein ligase A